MHYTVPRELFEDLVKNVGKESAEKFVNAIERFLEVIQKESQKEISEKKETLKAELY
ncbi:hypothetical protein RZR97_07815 [Hydrogenimonas thermophila]|uniref:hypothetical protein n=1 Tax=Hydrogenimonas thermophila TaxID=223786 RepID=UPI0029373F8C|nr:hypothetical protein [Hydrogenimonas thermophila]WOE69016.1 hypothetical protein RZR91_07835 [Hydrogenimonas thermophila]WOE71527.1 hypothetical protein RZR97_07815 [Hydrogenimonas thermophila]